MKKAIIQNLFPIPVYTTKMDRGFTKQELQFVKEQKKHCATNQGNINTKDNYILNRKEFKNIKKLLDECCKDYLDTIICPAKEQNLELYITQSWLNYTEKNQHHHKHEHPNSVVSGVLYFDSDINNDKIFFAHPIIYQQIKPEIDEEKYNLWNSSTWFFPVETGNLFMFPSSTTHQVETKQGNNTRISLAFNTFYRGNIGSNSKLIELKL